MTSCATTKHVDLSPIPAAAKSKERLLTSFVRIKTSSPDPICHPDDPAKCISPPIIASSGALVTTPNGQRGILTVAHALTALPPGQHVETYATLINGVVVSAKASICDFRIDVCFIFIDESVFNDTRIQTLELANEVPLWGDVVSYAGNPAGIADDFNGAIVPYHHGHFGGSSKFRTPWGVRRVSMVNVPATHGASGSVIVNEFNEYIGVVQMVHPTFPFSTLTVEFNDLVAFMSSILPLEEYRAK
jgi:hypothetical protein